MLCDFHRQSKLTLIVGIRSTEESEFMQFGTLKMLYMDQVEIVLTQSCLSSIKKRG
jgi:hypothetical protein